MARNQDSHFFVIIMCRAQFERLKIPDEFIQRHGNHLRYGVVELRVPNGETWTVRLVKRDDGEVWLEEGWTNFATRYCCSSLGHLLVFRHELSKKNNPDFHVMIFDMSTTEIEYGSSRVIGSSTDMIEINDDDDECLAEESQEEEDDGSCTYESRKARLEISIGGNGRSGRTRSSFQNQKGKLNHHRHPVLLRRAKAPIKCRNPHFCVLMSPSHVGRKCEMFVPVSHSREYYLSDNKDKTVSLHTTTEDGETKTWIVNCIYVHSVSRSTRVRFRSGWRDFVTDNRVRVGDECVFELIDQAGPKSYRVTVRRSDGYSEISTDSISTQKDLIVRPKRKLPTQQLQYERPNTISSAGWKTTLQNAPSSHDRVMQKAEAFKSKKPHFAIYMHRTYISGPSRLRIPQAHSNIFFSKVKGGGDNNVVTLSVSGAMPRSKKQTVRFLFERFRNSIKVRLGRGWIDFVKTNHLKVGDACIFELVNVKAKVYVVTIIRGNNEE